VLIIIIISYHYAVAIVSSKITVSSLIISLPRRHFYQPTTADVLQLTYTNLTNE